MRDANHGAMPEVCWLHMFEDGLTMFNCLTIVKSQFGSNYRPISTIVEKNKQSL